MLPDTEMGKGEEDIEVSLPPKTEKADEAAADEGTGEAVVEDVLTDETPFKTFATEEEYQTWAEEERQKLQPVVEQPTVPAGDPVIFDPEYKPKDWNDFAVNLLKSPEAVKILQEKIVPETRKAIEDMTTKERQELENINKGFDSEYNGLAKKGLLPALDSEEGQKLNQEISLIGATYGQVSLTKSYELWKNIPKAKGGGLEYTPPAKEKLNAQKAAAGKIGSSAGGAKAPAAKGRSYADLHNKNLDTIVSERLSEG